MIITKTYKEPAICEKEILRYAGCKNEDEEILLLLRSCIKEIQEKLSYKVCYRELPVSAEGDVCDFDCFSLRSKNLSQHLKDCRRVIVFAATIGTQIDRLIAKYGRLSPSRALMLQAIGAERIETLCDAFCRDIEKEKQTALCMRFSPGYGDLPLSVQKDIFAVLDCSKRIGLSLHDSLLMSPSKSVTAFVGITDGDVRIKKNTCSVCDKADCTFRGAK